MPQNKRESFIYSVMMCFTMVLWMSIYNVALHMGVLNFDTICAAWLGFPIAYVFAFCCDWFLVSGIAKKDLRFRFPCETRQQCDEKGHLHFQLYGSSDGDHHVHVWSVRGMRKIR